MALEVGAGTGKAARLFASRGVEVTALEPDSEMADLLARTTQGLPVEPVVVTFERFHTERRFDLVYAAAAWHWTDPRTRWAKVVELLVPGGVLALFGRPAELKDPALFAAVDDIERRLLPEQNQTAGHPWSIDDMARVDGLTEVIEQSLPGVVTTSAADFVARLATVSAYLTPEHRAEVLRQVRAVLPDQVDIDTTVQLTLGRRVLINGRASAARALRPGGTDRAGIHADDRVVSNRDPPPVQDTDARQPLCRRRAAERP